MNWQNSNFLISLSSAIKFSINHAFHGTIHQFEGMNTIPQSRLYLCAENAGSIHWELDGTKKSMKLVEENIYFIPCNIPLRFCFTGGLMAAIHFQLELIPGFDLFTTENDCRRIALHREEIVDIIHAFRSASSVPELLGIHSRIFVFISKFCNVGAERIENLLHIKAKYKDLFDLLDMDLNAQITVNDLAKTMGVSRGYLSRNFSKDTGITLKKYIEKRILSKAVQLLVTEDLRVNETAFRLGFSNEFYFSRFFKTQTGQPPSEYKNTYKL